MRDHAEGGPLGLLKGFKDFGSSDPASLRQRTEELRTQAQAHRERLEQLRKGWDEDRTHAAAAAGSAQPSPFDREAWMKQLEERRQRWAEERQRAEQRRADNL